MLTQLQLEGPELEPLLARVRNELGSRARIVHAEKIRSGGVAGFFAHERYELTVEVDTSRRSANQVARAVLIAAAQAHPGVLDDAVVRAAQEPTPPHGTPRAEPSRATPAADPLDVPTPVPGVPLPHPFVRQQP